MMDLDNVVSRELSETELEGIVGGMGRARAARAAKKNGTTTATTRTMKGTTVGTMPMMVTSTPIVTTM